MTVEYIDLTVSFSVGDKKIQQIIKVIMVAPQVILYKMNLKIFLAQNNHE